VEHLDSNALEVFVLPSRDGLVRIRANIAGEVELRVRVGEIVIPRQALAVVEGDEQIESLSVFQTSEVVEICVQDGQEVPKNTVLAVVREQKS